MSMTLGNVHRHFSNYKENELVLQLTLLDCGVSKCVKQKTSNKQSWVQKTVSKIMDYRKLCSYRDAANSFLELRVLLNVSGG